MLAPGSNTIAAVATNAYGNSSQALRLVTYYAEHQPRRRSDRERVV
jgi:hypothetical protein